MTYENFIGQLQAQARLPSEADAVTAVRATLQTLARRLEPEGSAHLAAQLPREIGVYLIEAAQGTGERFSFDKFCARVAVEENATPAEAEFHVRSVGQVLQKAVTPGQIEKIRAQLPEDFQPMFETAGALH